MTRFDVLKDIEKKLGLEYKHKYIIEPYDNKTSKTNFVLIYKGTFWSGTQAFLVSNYLDELDDNAQGIEVAMEYLNYIPKYKGKLKVELQKRKLSDHYWTLLWVDYWTNIDGQESKIHDMITASDLSSKDKSELYQMLTKKEHRVFAGYIPGDRQRAQSIADDISAGAFGEVPEHEVEKLKVLVKHVATKLSEEDKRLSSRD